MDIKDSILLHNFELLFKMNIIIYGAGANGTKAFGYLQNLELEKNILCFCETNAQLWKQINHSDLLSTIPVTSPDEAYQSCSGKETLIILACPQNCHDDILAKINTVFSQMSKGSFAVSWFGFWLSIAWNINNKRIPTAFRYLWLLEESVNCKTNTNSRKTNHNLCLLDEKPILVYAPTKVGSSSITKSLYHYGVANCHLHSIPDTCTEPTTAVEDIRFLFAHTWTKKKHIKVITLVRDPIARAVSWYFEFFYNGYIKRNPNIKAEGDIFTNILAFLKLNADMNWKDNLLQWFNEELKKNFSIDVYQHEFDKNNGYTIIQKDNLEILLLTLEAAGKNEQLIGRFAGIHDFHLNNTNVGSQKPYAYLYKEVLANLKIEPDLLDKYYILDKRLQHFYTDEQIKAFRLRWQY